jgi:DNA transformation protein
MAKTHDYLEYVIHDLMVGISGLSYRAMFGGYCLYKDGLVFAIFDQEKLYFKVDESNLADYQKQGSKQFTYPMKDGKMMGMNYWELPLDVLEDREELRLWVEKAYEVALRSKNKKAKK